MSPHRPSSSKSQNRRRQRKGFTLVIFALLLFALLALAALVIDLGIVRSAQRQMQTATDSAALEGMRFRQQVPEKWLDPTDSIGNELISAIGDPPASPQDPNDDAWQAWYDLASRYAASRNVSNTFDDDFNLAADARNFGAGPRLTFTGGIEISAEFNASQTMSIPSSRVYDPVLSLNSASNDPAGDIVAGNAIKPELATIEENDYSRTDFTTGATINGNRNGLLVRMRRTNETLDPAVGSTGGTIPYLFGRGSLIASDLKGRGISVRSTSIAASSYERLSFEPSREQLTVEVRAKSIGVRPSLAENPARDIPGRLPLVIYSDQWLSLQTNVATQYSINNGELVHVGTNDSLGHVVSIDLLSGTGRAMSIGDQVSEVDSSTTTSLAAILAQAALRGTENGTQVPYGLVPIVARLVGVDRYVVIGFGAILFPDGEADQGRIHVLSKHVPWTNAMATIATRTPVTSSPLTALQWTTLLDRHSDIDAPLLAPALVR